MTPHSLLRRGKYSLDWVKDFYTQSDIWWGPDAGEEDYAGRMAAIERYCGPGRKRILELGAGSGSVAVSLARAGHDLTAVELTPAIRAAQSANRAGWPGSLLALEADFYTVQLDTVQVDSRFDAVCYWDGFGVGTDADQLRLLRRVAAEWLAPGGRVLMDVFNPARIARHSSQVEILPPLAGVPGSVEMRHTVHYDPVYSRWVDEWEPTAAPEQTLAQTVRCYSPADLQLLLDGAGLVLARVEVDGRPVDFTSHTVSLGGPLLESWSYLAVLDRSA